MTSWAAAVLGGLAWELLDEVIDRAASPKQEPEPRRWCQHVEGAHDRHWRRPRKVKR